MKMYVIQYAAGGLVGPFLSLNDTDAWQMSHESECHIHELEPANIVEPFNLTLRQLVAGARIARGYRAPLDLTTLTEQFDLPMGWVGGWIGPINVGISPEGDVSS